MFHPAFALAPLPRPAMALKRAARLCLASALGLCLGLPAACAQPAPAQSEVNAAGETVFTVSSAEQLEQVMASIEGPAKVLLEPGQYSIAIISNVAANGDVEVTSVDPDRPALLAGLYLRNVSGVNFSNLALSLHVQDPRFANYLLSVGSSHNLKISDLTLRGFNDRVDPEIRNAAFLRNSHDIDFARNSFAYFRHGLSLLDVDNLTVRYNEFSHLQTDAIRGGGVNNAVFANNLMTEFRPAEGDHPDAIQLWTARQTEPNRNIVIRDNLVFKGDGGYVQGFFVQDTHHKLPVENLEISGNLLVGTLYHGIAVDGVTGGLIADNEVLHDPEQMSWINVNYGDRVVMRNNRAARYLLRDEQGPVEQVDNDVTDGDYSRRLDRVREWVASRESFADYRGPLLTGLIAP